MAGSHEREIVVNLDDVAATQSLGRRLAALCRAGDLIVLSGDLGAGKTTLVRALGEAMGVRGPITSPTFVVARHHPRQPPAVPGPDLIHVDAYRIESAGAIDDLDLLERADTAVTVVEWGEGRVEHLSHDRLHIFLTDVLADDEPGDAPDSRRVATIRSVGTRWSPDDLEAIACGVLD